MGTEYDGAMREPVASFLPYRLGWNLKHDRLCSEALTGKREHTYQEAAAGWSEAATGGCQASAAAGESLQKSARNPAGIARLHVS